MKTVNELKKVSPERVHEEIQDMADRLFEHRFNNAMIKHTGSKDGNIKTTNEQILLYRSSSHAFVEGYLIASLTEAIKQLQIAEAKIPVQ